MAAGCSEGIREVGNILNDKTRPLKERFRALFTLRNFSDSVESVEEISRCFSDDSVLLKHELAYCLGQMGRRDAVPVLSDILQNANEHPMVRHEAGEALGAIGDLETLPLLQKYSEDSCVDVAETCQLAFRKIQWLNDSSSYREKLKDSPYLSVDPAPPSSDCDKISELESKLLNTSNSLWDRYRAMFSLRNIGTDEAVTALAKGLYCTDSALFRHEVAYVLGQVQSNVCVAQLCQRLLDLKENCMVRHECAEALGSIGTIECEEILRLVSSLNYMTLLVKLMDIREASNLPMG